MYSLVVLESVLRDFPGLLPLTIVLRKSQSSLIQIDMQRAQEKKAKKFHSHLLNAPAFAIPLLWLLPFLSIQLPVCVELGSAKVSFEAVISLERWQLHRGQVRKILFISTLVDIQNRTGPCHGASLSFSTSAFTT